MSEVTVNTGAPTIDVEVTESGASALLDVTVSTPASIDVEINTLGLPGSDGADGADGSDGEGVPVGGSAGEVLAKASGTDYDTEWVAQSGGSSIILDLADDDSHESTALGEIGVSGDTNSIFTEPNADKLLIDVSQNWPTADLAVTVTTNANLTGHITSVGNAAVLGSFTKAQLSTAVSDGTPLYSGDEGSIDHDALLNFVAAEHIDWISYQLSYDIERRNLGLGTPDFSTRLAGGTEGSVTNAKWTAISLQEAYGITGLATVRTGQTSNEILIGEFYYTNEGGFPVSSGYLSDGDTAHSFNIQSATATMNGVHLLSVSDINKANDFFMVDSDGYVWARDIDPGGSTGNTGVVIATTSTGVTYAPAGGGGGKFGVAAVTQTEIEYVSGVTSAIQTQLNGKATSVQGALADSALQAADIDTLAEINAIIGDATLIDTADSRLSDSRTCDNTFDDAATSRTALGLGTAATLNVGTGASNIVQLDGSAKLPAVDGSQLTNLPGGGDLVSTNNLSDLANAATSRTNLGLGTAATSNTGDFATGAEGDLAATALQSADIDTLAEINAIIGDATLIDTADSRLSDSRTCDNTFDDAATSRTALGLGTAATLNVGTGASNIVQLDGSAKLPAVDGSQLTNLPGGGDLVSTNNLSDLANAATSRTNLGLGTAATSNTGDFATGAEGDLAATALQSADIDTLAEINAIIGDATLIDTADSRLSDSRTCDNTFDSASTSRTALGLSNKRRFGFVLDGGGSAIATGLQEISLPVPCGCAINAVVCEGPSTESGAITLDIWKATDHTTVPTNSNSICASAEPAISSGRYSRDATLTGWTTALTENNRLWINVDSNAGGYTRIWVTLEVTET